MSRTGFAILMAAIVVLVLGGMWIAWRARARRDGGLAGASLMPTGEIVAVFPRASYVSTTPVGSPFERIAIPGLRYKGFAEVTLRRDGVTIAVTGEPPVHLSVDQLTGTATAGGRIGKVVEQDGLSLLQWRPKPQTPAAAGSAPAPRTLESSFRFAAPPEQQAFADAIATIVTTDQTDTTQEDA